MSNSGDTWGQASVNNTNGFGKGAENNTISWGLIQGNSYGHPRTNLTGGGGSVIYGLQFDGVSNSMAIDFSSEASSLFEIELYNIGQNLRSVNAMIQTIGIESSVNVGYAETGLAITGLRTTAALITAPYANKALFSGDIEDISNALINGLNTGLTENLRTPFGLLPSYTIFIGSRADNAFPNSGILTRAQMGNLVADDSNNWLGATINGATRVQSTDGGVTWTPA